MPEPALSADLRCPDDARRRRLQFPRPVPADRRDRRHQSRRHPDLGCLHLSGRLPVTDLTNRQFGPTHRAPRRARRLRRRRRLSFFVVGAAHRHRLGHGLSWSASCSTSSVFNRLRRQSLVARAAGRLAVRLAARHGAVLLACLRRRSSSSSAPTTPLRSNRRRSSASSRRKRRAGSPGPRRLLASS